MSDDKFKPLTGEELCKAGDLLPDVHFAVIDPETGQQVFDHEAAARMERRRAIADRRAALDAGENVVVDYLDFAQERTAAKLDSGANVIDPDEDDDDPDDEELPPGHPQREYVNRMLGFDPALPDED